jgi:hypothetical protein
VEGDKRIEKHDELINYHESRGWTFFESVYISGLSIILRFYQ